MLMLTLWGYTVDTLADYYLPEEICCANTCSSAVLVHTMFNERHCRV